MTIKIELKDQKRMGVIPEHKHMRFLAGAITVDMRMTIPAREALQRVSEVHDGRYYYTTPPTGIVPVLAPALDSMGYMPALRCENEPDYPGEQPNNDMWLAVDLMPCPRCGAALVWYEAGYVPGYRVCAGPHHHHYIAAAHNYDLDPSQSAS